MKIELHMHTSEVSSCGKVPAAEMVRLYKEMGYDAITVTDHLIAGKNTIVYGEPPVAPVAIRIAHKIIDNVHHVETVEILFLHDFHQSGIVVCCIDIDKLGCYDARVFACDQSTSVVFSDFFSPVFINLTLLSKFSLFFVVFVSRAFWADFSQFKTYEKCGFFNRNASNDADIVKNVSDWKSTHFFSSRAILPFFPKVVFLCLPGSFTPTLSRSFHRKIISHSDGHSVVKK